MPPRILVFALVAACAADTRVQLDVATPSIAIDSFQLAIGDRLGLADARDRLDVIVPDAMAGTSQTIELWGLAAGRQVAYGSTTTTPVLHGKVTAAITLTEVACGTWCQLGSVACASDGVITCEQQIDGCLAWSDVSACPATAPFCSNGACGVTCTDECSAGAVTCDSAVTVRSCGQYDADSCLDWSAPTACDANQTCSNGTCASTQTCGGNGDACDDGNACTDDDRCDGDACTGEPVVCDDPPPATCVSSTTLRTHAAGTCSSGGCSYVPTDITCATGCANNKCNVIDVDAGADFTCAVKGDGTLACWGANGAGESTPPSGTFTQVSTGYDHACALRTNGTIACWGGSLSGATAAPSGTFKSVSAGTHFTCGLRTNNTIACWGTNTNGESSAPSGTFTAVSAGMYVACASRSSTPTIQCWGYLPPNHQMIMDTVPVTSMDVGWHGGIALRFGSNILHWGQPIPNWSYPSAMGFTQVSLGFRYACGILTSGALYCWGDGYEEGTAGPPSGTFRSISAGEAHACGIQADHRVVCWGLSANGATTVPAL